MIFCYSASQNSKVYAGVLSNITKLPIYMLDIKDNNTTRISFIMRALWSCFTKKAMPIINMPDTDKFKNDEIYICGPIWGGNPSAPLRYFLQNAPLSGKCVHLVLTSATSHDKYTNNAKKMLLSTDTTPGNVQVFAVDKQADIDTSIVEEHMRSLMFSEGVS